MNNDLKTIHTVRHILDESLDRVSPAVQARLNFAIQQALQVHAKVQQEKQVLKRKRFGIKSNIWSQLGSWLNKPGLSMAMSAAFVFFAVVGIIQTGQQFHDAKLTELANLDAEILVDDLPPAAYMDGGFVGYTSQDPAANQLQTDEQINQWIDSIPVQDDAQSSS